jgi:GT2 family glycosyltransferase
MAGRFGVVVIGRNEGERLRKCLESVTCAAGRVVYVDSGSTDASVPMARSMGAEVVELDMSTPFCAARARNAGYQRLVESHPQLSYVQFIDGDCEIVGDWLSFAVESLLSRPDHAIVAGWLREKSPETSIYNRLGDLEWNFTGAGAVDSVGGIFMIRREAFDGVGGFDSTVAAGEEPELCQRLIRAGWRLVKLDRDMALHDLAMTRIGQWWRRMVRNGYGCMDVASRFGVAKFAIINRRARVWTVWLLLMLVLSAAAGALPDSRSAVLLTLLLFSIWPAQLLRIALRTWRNGQPLGTSMAYAFFTVISFLPQITGQMLYFADRSRNRSLRLVEYKVPASSDEGPRA